MTKYLAYICGHYLPLGFEEFYATLEAENITHSLEFKDQQILGFSSQINPTAAAERCSFMHALLVLVSIGEVIENKLIMKEFIGLPEIDPSKTFAVRVKKIGLKTITKDIPDIEKELGAFVLEQIKGTKPKVNLKNPDYLFLALLVKNRIYFGLSIWKINRQEYFKREPGNRPFFRPGSMRTDFARAIVNLSRVRRDELFYDPFCGGGGFLIEASTLGAIALGSDIDKFAIYGSFQNMKFFKKNYFSILRSDSRKIPLKEVDAIATDPPYSIQSSTHGEKVNQLIYDFLEEAKSLLKTNKYLVFSSPAKSQSEYLAEKAGYQIQKIIDTRLHKSLTRRIIVLKC